MKMSKRKVFCLEFCAPFYQSSANLGGFTHCQGGWNVAASDISSVPGRKWILSGYSVDTQWMLHLPETEQESAQCNYLRWNLTSCTWANTSPRLEFFFFHLEHHETESLNFDFYPSGGCYILLGLCVILVL